MSQKNLSDRPPEVVWIPSICTNSAVEVLEFFAEDIIEIEASGASHTTNKDTLMKEINFNRSHTTDNKAELDYRRITDGSGTVENPITEGVVDRIKRNLRTKVYDSTLETEPDISVNYLRVDAHIANLQDHTRSRSDHYELEFRADPIQSKARKKETELLNIEKNLYCGLKFNYQDLHLRRVEETEAKYGKQSDSQIMSWGGINDVRPVGYGDRASQIITEEALPPEFGALKRFAVGEEELMEPFEEASDESDDEADGDTDE